MLSKISFLIMSLIFSVAAQADVQWSGVYRFESMLLDKPSLLSSGDKKEFAISHLVLQPKFIIADGFEVNARFDALNGATDQTVHPNNQIGYSFGSSSSNNDQYYTSSAGNAGADIIEVSQAYLTYVHNFGALIVGRAPIDFGLGMTYDAGNGLYDHWYDTRDLVGVKVHFGNMYVLPMYGKLNEGPIGQNSSDGQQLMIQAEYLNPDTNMSVGVFLSEKKANGDEHDFSNNFGGFPSPYVRDEDMKIRTMNFYFKKNLNKLNYQAEFSYVSGSTGLSLASEDVDIKAFGVAAEVDYALPEYSIDLGVKFGYASGDDKTTTDVESFIFNRNYDVGMLLMNHGLGEQDLLGVQSFLRKGYNVNDPATPNELRLEDYDVEAISNVFYFAPHLSYAIDDQFTVKGTLITALLLEVPENITDISRSLGYELDISVSYEPIERVNLMIEGAAFLPGSAYKDGNVDSEFTYGLMGKAAVRF